MTIIQTLRRLNAERTHLRWIAAGENVMNADCYPVAKCDVPDDAEYIAHLANSCTKLLDLVEKAKIVSATLQAGGADGYVDTHTAADLAEAIDALESHDDK